MWTLFKDKGSGSLYRKFQNFPSGYLQTSSDASFISHLIDTLEDLASYNEELDRLRTLTTRVADKQMTFVVQHPPFGDSLLRHYQRNFTLFSIYAGINCIFKHDMSLPTVKLNHVYTTWRGRSSIPPCHFGLP